MDMHSRKYSDFGTLLCEGLPRDFTLVPPGFIKLQGLEVKTLLEKESKSSCLPRHEKPHVQGGPPMRLAGKGHGRCVIRWTRWDARLTRPTVSTCKTAA